MPETITTTTPKKRRTNRWKARLSDGSIIQMPSDRSRSELESIKKYGLEAVLARLSRHNSILKLKLKVEAIIKPNGNELKKEIIHFNIQRELK